MIYALPGETKEAILEGAPSGLVGTIGIRLTNPLAGTTVQARRTTNISERPAGSGIYVTTIVAPTTKAEYLVVWDTVPGGAPLTPSTSFPEQFVVTANPPVTGGGILPYSPSKEQVATLLRARTKDSRGNELGAFTEDTRPTGDEVQELIDKASRSMATMIGTEIPDDLLEDASEVIALRVAMYIELSYFPEQVAANRSPYAQYKELFEEQMPQLLRAIETQESGEDPRNAPIQGAQFGFPAPDNLWSRRF